MNELSNEIGNTLDRARTGEGIEVVKPSHYGIRTEILQEPEVTSSKAGEISPLRREVFGDEFAASVFGVVVHHDYLITRIVPRHGLDHR